MRNRGRESLAEMLGAIPLFRSCTKDELRHLDQAAVMFDYPEGHVLCTEGAVGHELIVIVAGGARVERGGSEVAVVGAGDFIGELSLLDGGPRTATVTTVTPVKVLVLSSREFWSVLDQVPPLAHRLLATLAERLRLADERLY
jgi:CRP-like cAMP-binding protein